MNKEMIKREADSVDVVFYMLYAENKFLGEKDEKKLGTDIANELCVRSFLTRSGLEIQDPKKLLEEIEVYDDDNLFCFIFIDLEDTSAIRLSNNEKLEVIDLMKNSDGTKNCWQIVDQYLKEQENSDD